MLCCLKCGRSLEGEIDTGIAFKIEGITRYAVCGDCVTECIDDLLAGEAIREFYSEDFNHLLEMAKTVTE